MISALNLWLLGASALTGCSAEQLAGFLPSVRFDRLDVRAIDFEQIEADFVFQIDNPNPVGIPLERFSYDLSFEGVSLLSGNALDDLSLEAAGASEVALPVSLTFASIYALVEAARGDDLIGFALDGGFGFDSDIGPIDLMYHTEDSFPALRKPAITLTKLRLESLDLSAANLALDFSVDNDHGSAIALNDLDFLLEIAGAEIGGSLQALGEVEGASTRDFTLPFGVDYFEAVGAIRDAARGEPLDIRLGADIAVDTPFGLIDLPIDEEALMSLE